MKIEKIILAEKEIFSGTVDTLVVKEFYDLHGMSIPEGVKEKNYKQAKFRIVEQIYKMFADSDNSITDYVLFVNDEKTESWITAYEYNPEIRKLIIRACTGAG